MTNGDAAAAVGMDVVAGAADLRLAYDEINKSRDYLAAHRTAGTHPASAINSGTLDAARIPDLDAAKITTGTISSARLPAVTDATYADGPSAAAYARNAVGTGWYSVWMNSARQFMRNTSSRRYKKNIRPWAGSVRALRTVIFDRRDTGGQVDEVGFIAEEVNETLPAATVYFDGKIDGIDDRVILAAAVNDIQQLLTRVEQLEQRSN